MELKKIKVKFIIIPWIYLQAVDYLDKWFEKEGTKYDGIVWIYEDIPIIVGLKKLPKHVRFDRNSKPEVADPILAAFKSVYGEGVGKVNKNHVYIKVDSF